jgi:hypothetical protein
VDMPPENAFLVRSSAAVATRRLRRLRRGVADHRGCRCRRRLRRSPRPGVAFFR